MHAKPLYKTFDEYFAKNKIPSLKHQYVAYDVLKSQLLKTSQSTQVCFKIVFLFCLFCLKKNLKIDYCNNSYF